MSQESAMVSIVCPCYNEENAVNPFYVELSRALSEIPHVKFRIVFVDDGSRDGTLDRLNVIAERDHRVRVYSLSRNFGHQVALSAGLDVARGSAVIFMDSDLQHPPELIAKMIELWRTGWDIVSATRRQTQDASALKRASSALFYTIFNFLSDIQIIPGAADFCLLSRRAYRSIQSMPERHRFLRGMVSWVGFKRTCIPYTAAARVAGRSKYSNLKMIRLAADAVFSFSAKPLRLATRLGMLLAVAGALYMSYAIIYALATGQTEKGWTSLLCTILIIGGVQVVFIGIVGEYLARVLEQVKSRPLYLLQQRPVRRRTQRTRAIAAEELPRP